jgi:hypothetical protein
MLWLQAVKLAWGSYIGRMNKQLIPSHSLTPYLQQQTEMGMTLEEFGEMVFIEGFSAGEKYSKSLTFDKSKHESCCN